MKKQRMSGTKSVKKASSARSGGNAMVEDTSGAWLAVHAKSLQRATEVLKTGKGGGAINTPRGDMVIVRIVGTTPKHKASKDQTAVTLLPRVGRALSRPGISRDVVFSNPHGKTVYAYSLDPKDPTKMIREDASGHHTVGRVVNGIFRPLPAAA